MENQHPKPAFSTAEFIVVFALIVLMTGVFVTTTRNMRVGGSLLDRIPSVREPDAMTQKNSTPIQGTDTTHTSSPEQTSSASGNILIDGHCPASFRLEKNGGITPEGTVHIAIRALGSESTFGYRGPKVGVHASISTDNGVTWKPLFSLKDIDGDEEDHFSDVSGGSRILLRVEGRYGWSFQKTVSTGMDDPHSMVLEPGDTFPTALHGKTSIKPFLKKIVGADGTVIGNTGDIFILAELGELDARADFQDAVLQLRIERQTCDSLASPVLP